MDITKVKPVGKKILVEPYKVSEASGVEFVETNKTTPVRGKVLRAGDESAFREGQTVFFRRYSVDELKTQNPDGSETVLSLLEDEDVVAVLLD